MEEKPEIIQKLIQSGATPVIIEKYQDYQQSGNKQGQERLICRCMRMKREELKKERAQLACLDYMIVKVEKANEK